MKSLRLVIGLGLVLVGFPSMGIPVSIFEDIGESLIRALEHVHPSPSTVQPLIRTEEEKVPYGFKRVFYDHAVIQTDGSISLRQESALLASDYLGDFNHANDVANTWPAQAKDLIKRAEQNSLKNHWDSLAGYQNIPAATLEAFCSKYNLRRADNISVGDALAKTYQTMLDARLREADEMAMVVRQLRDAGRHDFQIGGFRLSRLEDLIDDSQFKLKELEKELSPSGATTSSKMPHGIVAALSENAKAGYCLNRLIVLREISLASFRDQLLPIAKDIKQAGSFWKLQRPITSEPGKMYDLQGVLNEGINQTTKDYKMRFHLLAPAYNQVKDLAETAATLKTSLDDVVVLNLLPTAKSQVKDWHGYAQGDLDGYVQWGQKVQNILNSRNVANVHDISSPEEVRQKILDARQNKRVLVILGEAADAKNIRLPGDKLLSTDRLVPSDMTVVGLFCGSAESLHQVPGLSVNGKLRADEAVTILKTLLSKVEGGETGSVGEFIGDSLINAAHNKNAILIVGGVSVGIAILVEQKPTKPVDNNSNH